MPVLARLCAADDAARVNRVGNGGDIRVANGVFCLAQLHPSEPWKLREATIALAPLSIVAFMYAACPVPSIVDFRYTGVIIGTPTVHLTTEEENLTYWYLRVFKGKPG